MKSWQLLIMGLLFGLISAGLVLLVASPTKTTPLSVIQPTADPDILVDVSGAVAHPGVYELQLGDRVNDAIQAAGGLLPYSSTVNINLAAYIRDGQKIYIPGKDVQLPESAIQPDASLLDLNRATLDDLIQLPGIGEQKAEAILQYRNQYGNFLAVDDLLYVPGIGDSLLDTLRKYVTVEK